MNLAIEEGGDALIGARRATLPHPPLLVEEHADGHVSVERTTLTCPSRGREDGHVSLVRIMPAYPARVPRYVVLLRGINVGRHRRLAMADLREMLAGLGYTAVRTLLNSGNAVVTGDDQPCAAHADRIATVIVERTGMDVPCIVLDADELRQIVAGNPFADVATDGSRMMAHVLSAAPDPGLLAEQDPTAEDPDRASIGPRVIYQWCPDGLMAAPPVGWPPTAQDAPTVTARNWNTITKLAELV